MLHIVNRPDLDFANCIHKPTLQRYAVAPDGGTVETIYSQMAFRKGDVIMESMDGNSYYCLTLEEFTGAYDVASDVAK